MPTAVLEVPRTNRGVLVTNNHEVTNAELGRRLEALAKEVHADLGEILRRMDAYVLREVYAADQRRREDQIQALDKRLDDERALRETAVATERRAREQAQERMRTTVRWLISALILPVGVVAAQIWLSTQGGG